MKRIVGCTMALCSLGLIAGEAGAQTPLRMALVRPAPGMVQAQRTLQNPLQSAVRQNARTPRLPQATILGSRNSDLGGLFPGINLPGLNVGPMGINMPGLHVGPMGIMMPGLSVGPGGIRMPGLNVGPGGINVGGPFGRLGRRNSTLGLGPAMSPFGTPLGMFGIPGVPSPGVATGIGVMTAGIAAGQGATIDAASGRPGVAFFKGSLSHLLSSAGIATVLASPY